MPFLVLASLTAAGQLAAPYDLSRFNIPFSVQWPTPPTTTQTI